MERMRWMVPVAVLALVVAGCGEEEPVEDVGVGEEIGAEPMVAEGEALGFAEWDADQDRRLNAGEFGTWMGGEGIFTNWNADANEGLGGEELGEGALGIWDTNDDAALTEDEWNAGVGDWFAEGEDFGAFGDWDLNDDNALDGAELGEGFERTGLFGDWDLNDNELLEENEFNEGLFGAWDANDDTFIAEDEWNSEIGAWDVT